MMRRPMFHRYPTPLSNFPELRNLRPQIAHCHLDSMVQFAITPLVSQRWLPQYNQADQSGERISRAPHPPPLPRNANLPICRPPPLEVACEVANTSARPWGLTGPSPEQRWLTRRPITAAERRRFHTTLTAMNTQVIAEFGLLPAELTRRAERANVDRTATRRALERLGYLFVSGGPIRLPLKSEMCQLIS